MHYNFVGRGIQWRSSHMSSVHYSGHNKIQSLVFNDRSQHPNLLMYNNQMGEVSLVYAFLNSKGCLITLKLTIKIFRFTQLQLYILLLKSQSSEFYPKLFSPLWTPLDSRKSVTTLKSTIHFFYFCRFPVILLKSPSSFFQISVPNQLFILLSKENFYIIKLTLLLCSSSESLLECNLVLNQFHFFGLSLALWILHHTETRISPIQFLPSAVYHRFPLVSLKRFSDPSQFQLFVFSVQQSGPYFTFFLILSPTRKSWIF